MVLFIGVIVGPGDRFVCETRHTLLNSRWLLQPAACLSHGDSHHAGFDADQLAKFVISESGPDAAGRRTAFVEQYNERGDSPEARFFAAVTEGRSALSSTERGLLQGDRIRFRVWAKGTVSCVGGRCMHAHNTTHTPLKAQHPTAHGCARSRPTAHGCVRSRPAAQVPWCSHDVPCGVMQLWRHV